MLEKNHSKNLIVIALTGKPRAGKDTAANYISKKYGFTKINLSDFLAELLKKKGEKVTKKRLSELGEKLRKEQGKNILARMLYRKINVLKKQGFKKFVVSGFRSVEAFNYIKKRIKRIVLVEVQAPRNTRFKRTTKDEKKFSDFLERERKELYDKGLLDLLKKTDFKVKNKHGKKELYASLDLVMEKILKLKV